MQKTATKSYTSEEEAFFERLLCELPLYVKREKRKTLSVSIDANGLPVIKAPQRRISNADIASFISSRKHWILEKRRLMLEAAKTASDAGGVLTDAEKEEIRRRAKAYIPGRVALLAGQYGIIYGNVSLRFMRSRWGSCTSGGDLCFNCLLMLTDADIIDSVILHELCHIGEMNHSARFYARLESMMPDYRERSARLKKMGPGLIMRLGGKDK